MQTGSLRLYISQENRTSKRFVLGKTRQPNSNLKSSQKHGSVMQSNIYIAPLYLFRGTLSAGLYAVLGVTRYKSNALL